MQIITRGQLANIHLPLATEERELLDKLVTAGDAGLIMNETFGALSSSERANLVIALYNLVTRGMAEPVMPAMGCSLDARVWHYRATTRGRSESFSRKPS